MATYQKVKPVLYRDYVVLGELGSGLSGKVHVARRADDATLVALKILHDKVDPLVRDCFLNEQRLLRKAQHPNIVAYIEGGSNVDESFIVTEFAEGTHLNSLVGKVMPPAAVLHIVERIGDALDYLHTQHPDHPIIHCDVKPHNIVLEGGRDPILLDLGSARTNFFAPAEDGVMLTPRYCAPEQLDHQHITQSDQFSLAVIAFELLSGKSLFRTDRKRIRDQRGSAGDDLAPLAKLSAEFVATKAVLQKGLEPLYKDRYPSCGAFATALGEALETDGLLTGDGRTVLKTYTGQINKQKFQLTKGHYMALGGITAAAMLALFFGSGFKGEPLVAGVTDEATVTVVGKAGDPTATLADVVALGEPTATLADAVSLGGDDATPTEAAADDADTPTADDASTPTKGKPTAKPTAKPTSTPVKAKATNTPVRSQPTPTPKPAVPTPKPATPTPKKATPTPRRGKPTPTPLPAGAFVMPNLKAFGENQAKGILAGLGVSPDRIQVQYQSRSHLGSLFDQYPAYAVVSSLPGTGAVVQPGALIILGVRSPTDDGK